jgi:cytochrome c
MIAMVVPSSRSSEFVMANQARPGRLGTSFFWRLCNARWPAKNGRFPLHPIDQPKEHPMKKLTLSVLAVFISMAGASSALAQDAAAGETSFKKCLPCHSIGEGAKNKVGPELNGLDGRKSGTVEGFSYSDANKNSGVTWNKEQFLDYIKDPKAKIPGTKMAFAGIRNEAEANALWAYISQFAMDGKKK